MWSAKSGSGELRASDGPGGKVTRLRLVMRAGCTANVDEPLARWGVTDPRCWNS